MEMLFQPGGTDESHLGQDRGSKMDDRKHSIQTPKACGRALSRIKNTVFVNL